ncbi:MAG: branched-chain amino acid ABC transporter permease [Deltaproteobacteria bacterium]|nr:MAG: branched-chain amino acid ABC transporter permease [Deltaproteobacteria bacterium]
MSILGSPQKGMNAARYIKLSLVLFFLIAVPLIWKENRYITTIFISALMFGIWGVMYDLQIGYGGLINFGFAGFICAGAYGSALAAHHYEINPWYCMLIGAAASGVLGFLTGVVTLRLKGIFVGLATWFLAEVLRLTISNTPGYTRGMLGLAVKPLPDMYGLNYSRAELLPYYYLLLAFVIIIFAIASLMVHSRIGLSFKAIREDQLATETLGLSATKYKLINFTTACFFTGLIGAFYAHYIGILTPDPTEFGVPRTVEVLTVAYVGGRGTLWGSILSGFLLIGFQEYFRGLGAWRLVMYGVLLITVMIYAPKGISSIKKYIW